MNQRLRSLCRATRGAYFLDYDALIARHGALSWRDERKWLLARMPLAGSALLPLASAYLRLLVPLTGHTRKALVVDLDDTLWGGVLGEVGADGLKLDAEYPGAAHQALQRAMLDLHRRGILLAISSKNDAEDALGVIRSHPHMLLREEHFAALRINWNDKATSCREIAHELGIGLDALVFLDDNPAERARVRLHAPEVYVPELPGDATLFATCLRELSVFEQVRVTAEDEKRATFYAAGRAREELRGSVASLTDYYRSLAMKAECGPASAGTVARVAQLTQKTNQFNMTTKRYGDAEIAALVGQGRAYVMRASDRFGDHGIVAVAITRVQDDVCELEALLMSCRVIGRTLETALLAFLAEQARASGRTRLRGWFLPTKKNAPARDVYPTHGFTEIAREGDAVLYELELAAGLPVTPPWIEATHTEPSP